MVKRFFTFLLLCFSLIGFSQSIFQTQDIIDDIYSQLSESEDIDYELLSDELLELSQTPINLNRTTADELSRLRFLSERQIDNILLYVYEHQIDSLSELRLIEGLHDYDIRNMLPFICAERVSTDAEKIKVADIFRYAKHEITFRTDARNIENNSPDPFYAQLRYKFDYQRKVQFTFTLRRPTGASPQNMLYGATLQLNDIGRFKSIVAGNFQASFGQGLVCSNTFHQGRNNYILNAGMTQNGLSRYNSPDGGSMHGVGTTIQTTRWLDISAFYSLNRIRQNKDTIFQHVIGANLTARYKQLRIGLTVVEKIYSDSLYIANRYYNANYFRGNNQAVIGLSFRYIYRWFDFFGEVATAQNTQWGYGLEIGGRITPISDIGLILLYRYYTPMFDNTLGYAFSQTSRLNDENGLYLGLDISRLRHWRFSGYADLFRFEQPKYGIRYSPSYGYEAMLKADYIRHDWDISARVKARSKGKDNTYNLRLTFNYQHKGWKLRSQADANLFTDNNTDNIPALYTSYGISVLQNIQYSFRRIPLVLQLRLQYFDTEQYENRIYAYENDVLYNWSMPFVYGQGARAYLNIRFQIIRQLYLYLRLSETVFTNASVVKRNLPNNTTTDIHLLLRAVL